MVHFVAGDDWVTDAQVIQQSLRTHPVDGLSGRLVVIPGEKK